MKKIGFLNFGHWTDSPQSAVRTASDALLQSVDLVGDDPESEAAEELQRLEDHLEQRHEVARAVLSLAAPGRAPTIPGNNQTG